MKTAFFWAVTLRVVVIRYRHLGQHIGTIFKGLRTSLRNCHYTPFNYRNKLVIGTQRKIRSFRKSHATTKCLNGKPEMAHASCHCTLIGSTEQ
jgi:hypothetical protein